MSENLEKIPEDNVLDVIDFQDSLQYSKSHRRQKSLKNMYFREKDFWQKYLRLDINLSNYKRKDLLNRIYQTEESDENELKTINRNEKYSENINI